MDDELLRYDKIVEDALRGVVRTALSQVADFGLPESHSFYVAFLTHYPGVSIPEHLRAEYPDEMTIVMEHQFWDLEVFDDRFEVKLSFNKVRERMVIPYSAISSFTDPSVQFGLKFEVADAGAVLDGNDTPELPAAAETGQETVAINDDGEPVKDEDESPRTGEVVNLDAFRKK